MHAYAYQINSIHLTIDFSYDLNKRVLVHDFCLIYVGIVLQNANNFEKLNKSASYGGFSCYLVLNGLTVRV